MTIKVIHCPSHEGARVEAVTGSWNEAPYWFFLSLRTRTAMCRFPTELNGAPTAGTQGRGASVERRVAGTMGTGETPTGRGWEALAA